MQTELLKPTDRGLYCPAGNFYVDAWKSVDRNIITHAHADHARMGSKSYLAAKEGEQVLRTRLGSDAQIEFQRYGEPVSVNGVKVTLYPAGHILGSAQIRIEKGGYVVVVSGDYKREADSTCTAYESIRCHTFVTESTFGLPIYRWPNPEKVFEQINAWWRSNQEVGKASLLLAYSLGKAQRVLAGIDSSIGPIYTHGAVEKLNESYRNSGISLPSTTYVGEVDAKQTDWTKALIIAPPSVMGGSWIRRFGKLSSALASGWMQIRGTRRRRGLDSGFILSDHVDWQGLIRSIEETESQSVWVTHGYAEVVARSLVERGIDARTIETEFQGELLEQQSEASQTEEATDG